MLEICLDKRLPVYEQIIDYYKQAIASGKLAPGSQIPSRRELAQEWGVNPNTVQKAYKEMSALGLIYTEGNSLSKVTEDRQLLERLRKELIEQAVIDFIEKIGPFELKEDRIIDIIHEYYQGRVGE